MPCSRCAELEAMLAASVSQDAVGRMLETLQRAQEATVNTLVSERAANLYTESEAHAILGGFVTTGPSEIPDVLAAQRSVVAAMQVQQPVAWLAYADALSWAVA